MKTILWQDLQGNSYEYEIHKIGDALPSAKGYYIYAKQPMVNRFLAVYIGCIKDLSKVYDEMPHHQMMIKGLSATHIHIRRSNEKLPEMRKIVKSMVVKNNPLGNDSGIRSAYL